MVTFYEKSIGSAEFLNRMVETLGIAVDRRSKGRHRKIKRKAIEKIECVIILIIKLRGKRKSDIVRQYLTPQDPRGTDELIRI